MAGLNALANLDQLCLLGSNCVLTWRETKYYCQSSKQIIVTSLAGRWLYFSHVQMEFEEQKLAEDVAWAGSPYVCSSCACIWLFACSSVCLSNYLSVYLFVACLSASQYIIYLSFFCIVADVSVQQVFISESAAGERLIQADSSICTFTLALCHRLSFNAKNYPGGHTSNWRLACFQISIH